MYKLICVLALSSLFACGNKPEPEATKISEAPKTEDVINENDKSDWKAYNNEELSFDYPTEWRFEESDKEKILFQIYPNRLGDEDGFLDNINLAIQPAPVNLTLEKVEQLVERGNSKLEGYELLKSNKLNSKGSEILNLEYLATRKGYNLKYKQHFIINGDKLYNFTFTAKPDSYSKRLDKVVKMFKSLHIK